MTTTRSTTAALAAVGTTLAALAAVAATPAQAAPVVTTTPAGGAYVAVAPTRALDTRTDGGAIGPGRTRTLDLSRIVPSTTATAVVLNLTVTGPTAPGYLTVFPAGGALPLASSINKRAGEIRSNSVTVALPANGSRELDIFNQAGSTQVVVDVDGFYDPAAVGRGATYHPSRYVGRYVDNRPDRLAPGEVRHVELENAELNSHHIIAFAATVTAVGTAGTSGYLTAWNGVGTQPATSTVNFSDDDVTPNFTVLPVSQDALGDISFDLEDNVASASVLVDVLGYYSTGDTDGDVYVPTTPTRVTDTRTAGGAFHHDENRCEAAGRGTALPSDAAAVNLNATAVDATTPTYLTVHTCEQTVPILSTLNPSTASARADATQPALSAGADGVPSYSVYNQAGTVQFVADLEGWFVPQA